jgi:hypothetical protein
VVWTVSLPHWQKEKTLFPCGIADGGVPQKRQYVTR